MKQTPFILIIDDDHRNIFALNLVLKTKGFSCLIASDAGEGLAVLKENPQIKIVLMDMMMPDMDGYEMLSLIRKEKGLESLKVIAVTAQAMPGDREKCIAAGADDYVSKPIDVDLIIGLIKNYITQ